MADYHSILKDLKSGVFAPVYFLQGEETFFIDSITDFVELNALDATQKSFNQVVLYGKDTSLVEVVGAARRYPMMGERQVVIVKEAQDLADWRKEDRQTMLLNYLENPLPSTILVFAYKYKSLDKRTKLGKALEKKTVLLSTKKLYDNQIPDWIQSYASTQGIKIENNAVIVLSENIGNNLKRIANELEKLKLNLKAGDAIDAAMIQRYVGISKDYNIFELQKAIGGRNKSKAFKIMNLFASDVKANPPVLIVSGLFSYFSKLLLIHHSGSKEQGAISKIIGVNPYFVREYLQAAANYPIRKVIGSLSAIKEADLQLKGIGYAPIKPERLLTELVFKIMN